MSESYPNPQSELLIGAGDRVARLDRVAPAALIVGIVLTLVCGVLAASGYAAPVAGSWVFGWYFWAFISIGMLGLTFLHHTLRPSWSLPMLRLWEAGASPVTLMIVAALFLPILISPGVVYEWARPEALTDRLLIHKAPYLSHGPWAARFIIFFGMWALMSAGFRRSVRRQEANGDFKLESGRSSWGAPSIVFFMLSATFAAFDWGMSLEPHWYSTMYGPLTIIAGALGACAFCVTLLCLNSTKKPYDEVVAPNLTKDWGNILFMFTMVWAYFAVSQYLIIWNGNLPETTSYFVRRSHMLWNGVGMAVIFGQFLVPWMTLLSPRVKRYPRLLRQIAGWIFVIHILDVYLAISPSLSVAGGEHEMHRYAGQFWYFDVLAFLAIGGIWLSVFAGQLRNAALLPKYDNRLQEALKHAH